MTLTCPSCGSEGFYAIEQVHARYYCKIHDRGEDGFEIDQDAQGEFIRDMATSVTIAYTCANEECGFTVAPGDLSKLKEAT